MIYNNICSICQQPPSVGKITKSDVQRGEYTVTEGKVLSCGHAFHLDCIKSVMFKNLKCPNCNTDIDLKDFSFKWIKVEDSSQKYERYFSVEEGISSTMFIDKEISEAEKTFIKETSSKLIKGEDVPGISLDRKETFTFNLKNN